MKYVHVGKMPVPRCIVPSFSNEVFYPGSAPAGVTPQYFTTLNVYQQWRQIFGSDVPLPEDERNLPGYPQSNLYTITGEEGPRYRYCSKERVWKLRSFFPMSKGRFLASCSHCRDVTLRRTAKRREDALGEVGELGENLFQGFQPNQDMAAPFQQPSMPMVNTDQRRYSVANLPLMLMNCTREGGEDDRDKQIAEAARLQSRISREDGILNETQRRLGDIHFAIDLLAEISNDDDGYQNNDQDTVLLSIEEELITAPLAIPEYFDNASEAGVEFAGRINGSLRFSPKPRAYPPLDEDGHVLSNNDPFIQNPRLNGELDDAFEREPGDGTKDVNMNSALRTLSRVSAGVLRGDSYTVLRDQHSIDSHYQQLSDHQTQNPQPQEGVDINRFRALSVSQEVQDQHAQYYQAQYRQPSPLQQFQFPARISSTFRDLSPHLPCQVSGHNSSYSQTQKATNDSAQGYPLTAHTPDLNPNLFENRNLTAVFGFGESTLGNSGHHGIKIQEGSARYQTLASEMTRETAQQAQQQQVQQFQPDDQTELTQLAQNEKNFYYPEAHNELTQEQLVQPTKLFQLAKQAWNQMAHNHRTQEQLALNARDVYDQLAYEELTQQNEPAHKPNLSHYELNQGQLAQNTGNFYDQQVHEQQYHDQLAQKARDARDVYDQRAYEEEAQQNQLTECIHHAHNQLSQLSQQTQLVRHEYQEFQAQKAQHQVRFQSQPFHSLSTFQFLPFHESAQLDQPIQHFKRSAGESSELLPQSEDSIRRFKRVRYREEIDTEMLEQQDTRAERVQRREEALELQQVEKATQLSLEEVQRLEKGREGVRGCDLWGQALEGW